MIYSYNKEVNTTNLHKEITDSEITIALKGISQSENDIQIEFKAALSEAEKAILDSIIEAHDPTRPSPQEPLLVKQEADYDENGRMIVRTAATNKGWHYLANFFEYETSSGMFYCKDAFGNDLQSQFSIQRLNQNGEQTQNEDEVVEDRVTWIPPFDFEIISGSIYSIALCESDLRVWTVGGAVDLGPVGSKEFVRGLNLRYVLSAKTDGRASKYMKRFTDGVPVQTNQLRFIFKHQAGLKHKAIINFELFKQ